jgi:maleate isomerase
MTGFSYKAEVIGNRRLGLVVLQTDETIELDFRRILPKDTDLYVTRVPSGLEVTRETLGAMESHIASAAALLPSAQSFDAVGYGCTSGTSVIGAARVAELVRQGVKTKAVTEPVSALVAACAELGLSRLAFLSPYIEEVSDTLRRVLVAKGIASPVFGSFDEAEEAKVVRISGASVIAAATALCEGQGVDALFLSCTNLRTLDVIDEIESRTGLPVLSSNQVLAWDMCRLAGVAPAGGQFGRLFSLRC